MPCQICKFTNIEFTIMCSDQNTLNDFLVAHNVLPTRKLCDICAQECTLDKNKNAYRCQKATIINKKKKKHDFYVSVYKNTFFDGSHLSSKEICMFVMIWLSRDPPRQIYIERELNISSDTVVDWSSFCREVLIDWTMNKEECQLGGEGEIVEIDEAKIGKRKYNKGRLLEGQWVFGGILRSNPQKVFVVPVENRNKETLLEVIKKKIAPGTTVISDCWKAYDCLKNEGFQHLTVNHSLNFVDPDTGAHTQNIERTWKEVRSKVPRYGRKKDHYVGYLAEFMFKRAYPDHRDRIHQFFMAAGKLYAHN